MAWTQDYSLFHHFNPGEILTGDLDPIDLVIVFAAAIVPLVYALWSSRSATSPRRPSVSTAPARGDGLDGGHRLARRDASASDGLVRAAPADRNRRSSGSSWFRPVPLVRSRTATAPVSRGRRARSPSAPRHQPSRRAPARSRSRPAPRRRFAAPRARRMPASEQRLRMPAAGWSSVRSDQRRACSSSTRA